MNETRANPFGLVQVVGNVSEWCADPYLPGYWSAPLRALDGLASGEGFGHRSIRGGYWGEAFFNGRSAFRSDRMEGSRSADVGVRPARALRP